MQYQVSKSRQDLVVGNSKLSNQDIVIPRLELIATHIVTRLATNTMKGLKDYNKSWATKWTDSTLSLHYLKDQVSYKVFV